MGTTPKFTDTLQLVFGIIGCLLVIIIPICLVARCMKQQKEHRKMNKRMHRHKMRQKRKAFFARLENVRPKPLKGLDVTKMCSTFFGEDGEVVSYKMSTSPLKSEDYKSWFGNPSSGSGSDVSIVIEAGEQQMGEESRTATRSGTFEMVLRTSPKSLSPEIVETSEAFEFES